MLSLIDITTLMDIIYTSSTALNLNKGQCFVSFYGNLAESKIVQDRWVESFLSHVTLPQLPRRDTCTLKAYHSFNFMS